MASAIARRPLKKFVIQSAKHRWSRCVPCSLTSRYSIPVNFGNTVSGSVNLDRRPRYCTLSPRAWIEREHSPQPGRSCSPH